jgi:hypothetical protein
VVNLSWETAKLTLTQVNSVGYRTLTLPLRPFVSWCRDHAYCLEMATLASLTLLPGERDRNVRYKTFALP